MAKRGALRMGAHVMTGSLLLCCLLALVIPAKSLKCHTCVGNDNECSPTEVTCPGENDVCATSALHIDSFPCKVQKVFKGCINSSTNSTKLSISPSQLVTLSLQQETCNLDLCNTKKIPDLVPDENDLFCHSCISPENSCDSDKMKEMRCMGEQNLCLDMKVIGSFGDIADVSIKGCGRIPSCKENLVFSSQTSSVAVKCCKGNFCNNDVDSEPEDKTPNGIQCYSCNTLDGARCSPEEVVKAQCYGELTSCLEVEGISMKDGRLTSTVIKGCATPSICNSLVLPLLQKLGTATVKCCNGSLCNNQFSESGLQASGYLPIGNASPGTGIQNTPSSDATHGGTSRRRKRFGSPVKTGHHTNNKYGTGSMPTSSSTYHKDDGSSEFSGPNMSPGNSNAEDIKGGSWHSNSNSGYPNPSFHSYHCIFAESESSIVPNFINYSSGERNLSALSPGGSAVGDNYSNSNVSSIPNVPPTFPDFNSYGDSSIVPNNDNNVNNSNTNDFNSYESVGFIEIVYADIDSNGAQSGSTTVAPRRTVSNTYASIGNSRTDNSTAAGSESHTIFSPANSSSGGKNVSVLSPGVPGLGGEVPPNSTTYSNSNVSSVPDVAPTVPDFNSYGDSSIAPNLYYENNGNSQDNNDFNSYESVGFTEIVYVDIDSNDSQSSSPTVAPGGIDSNSYDSYNQNIILSAKGNGTSDYSADTVNPNVLQNNAGTHILTSTTPKTHNSDIKQQISGDYTDIYNTGMAKNNGSGNYISSSGHNPTGSGNDSSVGTAGIFTPSENPTVSSPVNSSSGQNNLNMLSPGGPGLGGEFPPNSTNYSNSDVSSIPEVPPTFPDFNSYGDSSIVPNPYYDNNMNNQDNNDFSIYESIGFTEIVYVDVVLNNGQPGSPTEDPGSIDSNSYDSVDNSGTDSNAYNPNIILSANNNGSAQHLAPEKNPNSGIKQHISGHGSNIYNTGIANNNGSGNYISSSGNNPAGSGNNSSAGTYGSSSFGGSTTVPGGNGSSTPYTSSGNGTGMTNEWNNSNFSSNHNMVVPLGYTNSPGSNHSSPTHGGSGNGTGMSSQWIYSNDSNHNMVAPVGNNNIPGNNHSSTSYTGNGTGMSNGWSYNNSSNPSMAVPGEYANISGNNATTTYTSSGKGTGMTQGCSNGSSSNHSMSVPGGYANVPGGNNSSTWYASSGNGTGMTHGWSNGSSSNHSMSVPGGYANVPGSNNSSTSYVSSGNGTEVTHAWSNGSSFNHSMSVPGGYANVPGSNNSSTSYVSSGNGTGVTHAWSNVSSSNHSMSVPGGYANVPGSNISSTSYVSSGNGTGMTHGWSNGSSSNHSMSVPGGYANVPGSNNSSTSYASPGNGTGMTNEWINSSSSSHNMASPGGSYGSFIGNGSNGFPNSNHSSHPMIPYESTYGNGSSFDSIESYLNHVSSGANNNGSYSNTSSWPGGSNHSNETAWIYGSNYNPNMLPNSNGSFSNYNGIQDFLSKLNGSTHGNGSVNVSEWIQNHGYFSNFLPPGMNHNGSGPYTMNGSLADYMNSLGNIPNITNVFSGGNNGSFNISNFGSGWGNIMYNPNLMNPNAPHNDSTYSSRPIPSNNESSYSNIHKPNLSGSPNSNGSTNTNGYFGVPGFNGRPNNTNGMFSGGYNNGSVYGNGNNSYLMPHGGNNSGAFLNNGSNLGHESVNSSNYNSNMMIPGVGSGYHMGHGLNGSILGNGSNTGGAWSNGNSPDELIPGRSTNDSTTGDAGNNTVGGNGTMSNGASSLWTKSGSFVIFSAIALLVLS